MSCYDHLGLRILATAAITVTAYGLIYVLFSFVERRGRARGRLDPRGAPRVVAAPPSAAGAPLATGAPDLETTSAELEDLMARRLQRRSRAGGKR